MTDDARAHAEDDSVDRFARDLRALRLEADSPTLERLRSETGISRTVLSEAFAGRSLPTARTVDRIARACGADPLAWVQRRDSLAAAVRARKAQEAAPPGGPAPEAAVPAAAVPASASPAPPGPGGLGVGSGPRRRVVVGRGEVAGLAVASFLAGAAVTALVLLILLPALLPGAAAEPGIRAASSQTAHSAAREGALPG